MHFEVLFYMQKYLGVYVVCLLNEYPISPCMSFIVKWPSLFLMKFSALKSTVSDTVMCVYVYIALMYIHTYTDTNIYPYVYIYNFHKFCLFKWVSCEKIGLDLNFLLI